MVVEVAPL